MCIGKINKMGYIHAPALILLHCLWWTIQKPAHLAITKSLLLIYQWLKTVAWNFATYRHQLFQKSFAAHWACFSLEPSSQQMVVDNENRKFFEVLLFVSFPNLQILWTFYWGQQEFYHTELKRWFQGIPVINSVTFYFKSKYIQRHIISCPLLPGFYVSEKSSVLKRLMMTSLVVRSTHAI